MGVVKKGRHTGRPQKDIKSQERKNSKQFALKKENVHQNRLVEKWINVYDKTV